jgi:hypothetical protein
MARGLRSSTKKTQVKEKMSSKLSTINKSKTIKRAYKKAKDVKNEDNRQNVVWNFNSILSNIFKYADRKDVIEFSTVCKKWNSIINPIIHKTIKLDRRPVSPGVRIKLRNEASLIDAEVRGCLFHNAKHAHLVKNFRFYYKLEPRRAIKVFKTFKFICNLTIDFRSISQDQILGMIGPLNQLQVLNLGNLTIKNSFRKGIYKAIQLPASLKVLRMQDMYLDENTELFIQTMNTHNNLIEFSVRSNSSQAFLDPFYKHYPSLLNFDFGFYNIENQTSESLFAVFENNPQLISLKMPLEYMKGELVNHISTYLTNLEEFSFTGLYVNGYDTTDINFKFSQPTKIKKLNIDFDRLSNYPLNFTLLNCPDLEELGLNRNIYYNQLNYVNFLNLSNYSKIKKLSIDCGVLGEGVFDSLLLSCLYLNELDIKLHLEWKKELKPIYERCTNLERLTIFHHFHDDTEEFNTFNREFYDTEIFTGSHKLKSTLTHLTLDRFKADGSKVEHFKSFQNLKSIKYSEQRPYVIVDMDLWPGYILVKIDNHNNCDYEFKRI